MATAERKCLLGNAHSMKTLRSFIEGGLLALIAVLLAATWIVRSFVVAGPSMAETIVDEHRRLTCGDCGYNFRCDAAAPEMPGRRAVCPNCGDARQRLDTAPRQAGDAIVVDRSAFLLRAPRRWELAAFRGGEPDAQLYVKRIVGLPGEMIELRQGDVYANGAIQRKTLAQLRAIAVPVYDSRHEPDSLASRWLPEAAESGWRRVGSHFRHAATGCQQRGIDWLTYRHRRRTAAGSAEECAVLDDSGYNQQSPVTESHYVRDLLVSCRIEIADSPTVNWSITDGTSQFLIELDFVRSGARAMQDGRVLGSGAWRATAAESVLFELALCDQQVLMAIDDSPVLSLMYQPADVPFRPASRPLAVGTAGGRLALSDLVLSRDVYYRPPHGKPATRQDPLSDNEYFVLGDNSVASLDSRDWPQAGIAASNFVGKPVLAYSSGLAEDEQGLQFKVPVVSDFRYIH